MKPKRLKARTGMKNSIWPKSKTKNGKSRLALEKRDEEDSGLEKLWTKGLKPSSATSKTKRLKSIHVQPKTDDKKPIHFMLCKNAELPTCTKSNMNIDNPHRTGERTEVTNPV